MRGILTWTMATALLAAIGGCGGGQPDDAAGGAPDGQPAQTTDGARDAQSGTQPAGPTEAAGRSEVPSTSPGAAAPGAAAAGGIDVSFISEDFIGAVVLHPARLLESRLYRELSEQPGLGGGEEWMGEMIEHTGVDPREVEQVIVLVDREQAAAASQVPFMLGGGLGRPDEEFMFEEAPPGFGPPEVAPFDAAPENGAGAPAFDFRRDRVVPDEAPADVPEQGAALPLDDFREPATVHTSALAQAFGAQDGLAAQEGPAAQDAADEFDFEAFRRQARAQIQRNNMRMLGLAMHNYHDVHGQFPHADSGAGGAGKGLSWRVHLLPYLDEAQLYREFKLDEPWDSEHNRQLIDRMPDVFATAGVEEAGKTTLHVLVGEAVPFGEGRRPAIREFTDGMSNTLLVVEAGADAAVEWTKPGGLAFDPDDPKRALGTLPADGFFVLFADGSRVRLRSDVPDGLFKKLATHQGREPIDDDERHQFVMTEPDAFDFDGDFGPPPQPAVIVRFRRDIDPQELVERAFGRTIHGIDADGNEVPPQRVPPEMETREHAGRTYWLVDAPGAPAAVHAPDPRTLVVATEETLLKMLEAERVDSPLVTRLRQIGGGHDLMLVLDLSSSREELGQAAEMAGEFVPPLFAGFVNMLSQVNALVVTADLTGETQPLVSLALGTDSSEAAHQLNQAVGGLVMLGQQLYQEWRQTADEADVEPQFRPLLPLADQLVAGVTTSATGDDFVLAVSKPADLERLPELLKPAMEEAHQVRARLERNKKLHAVALAMHNYHDAYGHFPFVDRGPRPDDPNRGLGWRAYLAPYVDAGPTYNAMNVEEPWDSEQNRPLVRQIPGVYVTPGADEGFTTMHVFVGEGAPFGGDEPLRISRIIDGTSHTILAVRAGPETAIEWTRPGGLEFDPDNPKQALGTISDEGLPVVFFDGSSRVLSKDIPDELLKALITPAGGEVIDYDELERFTIR